MVYNVANNHLYIKNRPLKFLTCSGLFLAKLLDNGLIGGFLRILFLKNHIKDVVRYL